MARLDLFYRNPRLTALSIGFVLLIGASALLGLARQEDPTMTERWASVSTFLPGATAARVESLVSEPLETRLREIPEIRNIESNSRAGYSLISIELYDRVGADAVEVVWAEVRDKLAEAQPNLPAGSTHPRLEMRAPIAATLVVGFRWTGADAPQLGILSRLAEALRIELANLPATKEARLYGEAEEQVLVTIDPYRLSAAGLGLGQVAEAVSSADTKLSAGRLRHSASDLLLEVDAELDSPERIAGIPLLSQPDGQTLRLGDVAEVRKAVQDPPRTMAFQGRDRTVFVEVKMEPEHRIDTWMADALRKVEQFRDQLPGGVALEVVYDQNDYTSARLVELLINLVSALVIVLATLVWFMGIRSALTVGIALPLSGAMVLGAMHVMDIPLHQMSVTGLIISLGLLIDNAIVVIEEYKLARRRGLEIDHAISAAIGHLLVPLGASTLTTVFAFLTIAMAPGGTGDFTGTIGVSVVLAVTSSYLLSMSVVPALAGFIERRWPHQPGTHWWQGGYTNARLTARYRQSLDYVFARPGLALAIGCALPLSGFLLAPTLTQQFFPPVDRNQFQVQISLPTHASIHETTDAVARVESILREYPGIVASHWSVGEGAPRPYYNVLSMNEGVSSFAGGWVNTDSAETTRRVLPELQARLIRELPQAQVLALPFEQGPPFDAPISIRVVGPSLDTLRTISDQLRLLLASLPDVTYTRASVSAAEPKLVFRPAENAAAAAGLTTGELPGLLNDALAGIPAGTVQEGNRELTVQIRLANDRRDEIHKLTSLPMTSRNGATVPLEALGDWGLAPSTASIQRYQGERISSVQAFLSPFVLPAGAMAEFRDRLAEADLHLPPGYRLDIGGEEEERSESVGGLVSVFAIFALAMAGVVVLSLNSFRQGAMIGAVGLLSFGLALFGVRLFGYPFGFTALIGALGMVGLSINSAIIVISALKADAGVQAGEPGAATAVVLDATRHIVSTTVTTIGGFIPLILFGGTFWPPLATSIAGGVGGSAIIALYTVPAVYVWLERRRPSQSPAAATAGSGGRHSLSAAS
jgi:multidrug efflux pump subunit AcrB